eukprot:2832416-Heterocapsa_arctica.AAC.1
MEAYSDHSNNITTHELYLHQIRPSIEPGGKRSGKAHHLLCNFRRPQRDLCPNLNIILGETDLIW